MSGASHVAPHRWADAGSVRSMISWSDCGLAAFYHGTCRTLWYGI